MESISTECLVHHIASAQRMEAHCHSQPWEHAARQLDGRVKQEGGSEVR
jgi:hypothetical protein